MKKTFKKKIFRSGLDSFCHVLDEGGEGGVWDCMLNQVKSNEFFVKKLIFFLKDQYC